MEIRRYECPSCHNKFWVDCDDTDYPSYCPFCGEPHYYDENNEISDFIKSQHTEIISDKDE